MELEEREKEWNSSIFLIKYEAKEIGENGRFLPSSNLPSSPKSC
jgi:hypothetical protein